MVEPVIVVEKHRNMDGFVIDLAGLSGVSTVDLDNYVTIYNQYGIPLYVKAVLEDPTGNYTLVDSGGNEVSELTIGQINGFSKKTLNITVRRKSVPSSYTSETIRVKLLGYSDSNYTDLVTSGVWNIPLEFEDFDNPSVYTVDLIDEFDDGTNPGWSSGSVVRDGSVKAGGYSLRIGGCNSVISGVHSWYSTSRTINIPQGSSVVAILYYAARLTRTYSWPVWQKDLQILLDEDVLYHRPGTYVSCSGNITTKGWYQVSVDLTKYAGSDNRTFTVKTYIYVDVDADGCSYLYIDRFIIAHK